MKFLFTHSILILMLYIRRNYYVNTLIASMKFRINSFVEKYLQWNYKCILIGYVNSIDSVQIENEIIKIEHECEWLVGTQCDNTFIDKQRHQKCKQSNQ